MKEILFCVYYNGWWGCLDPIYRKHIAEGDCNVTVFHVPIMEKDRQRGIALEESLKFTWDDEAREGLPEDIKCHTIESFNPLDKQYDVIYVHNPYDGENPVDTTLPEFYSDSLKSHAQKLIYVPHFLASCVTEKMRILSSYNNFDEIYAWFVESNLEWDVEWDSKIVEYPCTITEYMDDLKDKVKPVYENWPDSWKEQAVGLGINKSDIDGNGEDKKAVLILYVSYHDIYYQTERAINRFKLILDIIAERSDVLIVLRIDREVDMYESDLTETVKDMYHDFLDDFINNKRGIVDYTEDDYYAANLADGFLGYGSHWFNTLFTSQGKRCIFLDTMGAPIATDLDLRMIEFWEPYFEGGKAYFTPTLTKSLYSFDMDTFKCEKIVEVPDERNDWLNYIGVVKHEDDFVFVPYNSKYLWTYHVEEKEFEAIRLPEYVNASFTKGVVFKDKLILIPRLYKGILIYDFIKEEFTLEDSFIKTIDNAALAGYDKEPYFLWGVRQYENKLYLASSKANLFMIYDMENGEYEMHTIPLPEGVNGYRVFDFEIIDNTVFFAPFLCGEIILWNMKDNSSRVVYCEKSDENRFCPFERVVRDSKGRLAFLPKVSKGLLVLDTDGNEVNVSRGEKSLDMDYKKGKEQISDYQKRRMIGVTNGILLEDGRMLLFEEYDGSIIIADENYEIIEKIPFLYSQEDMEAYHYRLNCQWYNGRRQNGWMSEGMSIRRTLDYFVRNTGALEGFKEKVRERIVGYENVKADF